MLFKLAIPVLLLVYQAIFAQKTVDFKPIWSWIAGIEGEHADHHDGLTENMVSFEYFEPVQIPSSTITMN